MEGDYKEVDYHAYCGSCKHSQLLGSEEPCNTCLDEPVRPDSHKPAKWEGK